MPLGSATKSSRVPAADPPASDRRTRTSACFGPGRVAAAGASTTLASGPGGYDGVEVLSNGNVLVSSWTDSTVHILYGGTHMMALIRNVAAPADIGVDTKRNVVAIPRFNDGKVEFYKIP